MNYDLIEITASFLAEAVTQGYKKGIKDVVKKNKKSIEKFADKPDYLEIDYTLEDEEALKNFKRECFEVAGVGSYDMEEALKEEALNSNTFEDFEAEARRIMLEYIPLEDQAPSGWLETNFNTALNSSYSAAQYNRLQDPDVRDLYPAYEYKTRNDDRVRPEHEALEGMIFLNDDPLLDVIYPPNDWNCRCYMAPLDPEELAEKENKPLSPVRDEDTEKEIVSNVAPDFRRNPAKEKSIYDKWLKQKYKDMPKPLVKEIKQKAKEFSNQ